MLRRVMVRGLAVAFGAALGLGVGILPALAADRVVGSRVASSVSRLAWPEGHLYVLDTTGAAVYRFPLGADGLPAAQPDGVLSLVGAQDPQGMTVDREGHIFVADDYANVVNEYPAGATGRRLPFSTLLVQGAPDHLKVDYEGRLYVHRYIGSIYYIAIYEKGAKGHDAPLNLITADHGNGLMSDYVLSPSGVLYVMDWAVGVVVYNDPLRHRHPALPSDPDAILLANGGEWETSFWYTLALDEPADTLYIQFASRSGYQWNTVNFARRSLRGSSSLVDPLIFNGQCGNQSYSGTNSALVVKRYLMVSCLPSNNVLVLDKNRFGRRKAVEILGPPLFTGVSEIAVGP